MNQSKNKSFKVIVDPKNKPDLLRNNEWQALLRKQYAHIQKLKVKNIGGESFYSDFLVSNPHSKNQYKVAIRSVSEPLNFCECLDFKTNKLGTCKHIEAVFLQLESLPHVDLEITKKSPKNYSSIYVDYLHHRHVKIRKSNATPPELLKEVLACFDDTECLIVEKANDLENIISRNSNVSSFIVYSDAKELIQWHSDYLKRVSVLETIQIKTEIQKYSNLELRDYQVQQIEFMLVHPKAIISNELAMGLSHSIIGSIILHKSLFHSSSTIIVSETPEYWQSKIEKYTTFVVRILNRKDLKLLPTSSNHDRIINVIKPEELVAEAKRIESFTFDYIVFDNADVFSKLETDSSVILKSIKSKFKHILSNRFLVSDINSFYSQLQAVDMYFPGSYFNFLNRYALKNVHGTIVAIKNENELLDRVKSIYHHTLLTEELSCRRCMRIQPIQTHRNIYDKTVYSENFEEHVSPFQLYELSSSSYLFNHGFAESKLISLVELLKLINLESYQVAIVTKFENYVDVIRTHLMQSEVAMNGELHKSITVLHSDDVTHTTEVDYVISLDYFAENNSIKSKASITLLSADTFESYLHQTATALSDIQIAFRNYIDQVKAARTRKSLTDNVTVQADLFKAKLTDQQIEILSQISLVEKLLESWDENENIEELMTDFTEFQKQVITFYITNKKNK